MNYSKARRLLFFDGLGALLSILLLAVVLVQLEWFFGIPKSVLYILAVLPCLFALYDFFCVLFVNDPLGKYLTGIAIANLLYCCLSIGLVSYHRQELTTYGWTYIILEVVVLIALASIELKVAKGAMRNGT